MSVEPAISPLVRTAIIVTDLERSIRFYRDVLGIGEVYHQGHLNDPAAGRLLGMPPSAETRYAIVKVAGPALGMVGLFEIVNHSPPALGRAAEGLSSGETCLVFYHRDLTVLTERLESGGHKIVCPAIRLKINDDFSSREMTFRDPDGVMINCIERDPDTVWAEQRFAADQQPR